MNNPTETTKTKNIQRRNLVYTAVIAILVVGGFVLWLGMDEKNSQVAKDNTSEKPAFEDVTAHAGGGSVLVEKVQHDVDENRRRMDEMQKKALDESSLSPMIARMKALEETVTDLREQLNAKDQAMTVSAEGHGGAEAIDTGLREDKLTLTPRKTIKRPSKNPDVYVPAGTFVQAIMIGGADASAAVNAQANPVPMLFRVVADGTLPNHQKSHLKDCVMTAAVVGDISSERGQIRTERMSCVFANGRVLDVPVEGTVFGPGGRNGVRGTPVWREGALLQRAFAAGALGGLSDSLSQTYTSNSISPEGAVQTVNPGRIFQYGGAKGVGKAMDKLADYNVQRAEQYHPVIQISAGTSVDVVFLKGFFLNEGESGEVDEKSERDEKTAGPFDAPQTMNTVSQEERTLPLSEAQIRKLQDRGKELGFRVRSTEGENRHV